MAKGNGNADERYEVEFMHERLKEDDKNDTSIMIPASILVCQKDLPGKKMCEFDGLVIHPMRRDKQVMLLEAKNTKSKPSHAKNCLSTKLDKLNYKYDSNDMKIYENNARLWKTI